METMTPGEVALHLRVSDPTVRRMAAAYELVFGNLERDARGHRLWSLDAVRRVQAAHGALSTGKVSSLDHALKMVRDGLDLPAPTVLPVERDLLGELLDEVRGLRALAEAQGRELAALRSAVAVGLALPAPAPAGDLLGELQALRALVTAQGEREAERFRLAAHVGPAQEAPRPARGGKAWLLRLLGVQP